MKQDKIKICSNISVDVKERLDKYHEKTSIPMSAVVEKAVVEYLDKYDKD